MLSQLFSFTQRAVDVTQNLLISAGKLKKPFARSILVSDDYLPR